MNTESYFYIPEQLSSFEHTTESLMKTMQEPIINMLCYHVTTSSEYPFIQFMLEKLPSNIEGISEEFVLPCLLLQNNGELVKNLIEQLKKQLTILGCDLVKLKNTSYDSMYKGMIKDSKDNYYALMNISDIDISDLYLCRDSPIWFGLTTEIINSQSICNIPIHYQLTELFTLESVNYSHLHNPITQQIYLSPDAVYTGTTFKQAKFQSVFGNCRFNSKMQDKHYYFYRDFGEAIKEAVFIQNKPNEAFNSEINDFQTSTKGGINRYALFLKQCTVKLSIEEDDDYVQDYENDNSILTYIIQQDSLLKRNGVPFSHDICCKEYSLFTPLSYHGIDKITLSQITQNYDYNKKNEYMVC
jgi:hypothetical protein